MSHAALRIIHDEHAALSAMLRSIVLLLGQHRRNGTLPDFAALRAMLFYVDEFPEQRHHRKESELLFPKLRARTAEAGAVLAFSAAAFQRSLVFLGHAAQPEPKKERTARG